MTALKPGYAHAAHPPVLVSMPDAANVARVVRHPLRSITGRSAGAVPIRCGLPPISLLSGRPLCAADGSSCGHHGAKANTAFSCAPPTHLDAVTPAGHCFALHMA